MSRGRGGINAHGKTNDTIIFNTETLEHVLFKYTTGISFKFAEAPFNQVALVGPGHLVGIVNENYGMGVSVTQGFGSDIPRLVSYRGDLNKLEVLI